MGVKKADEYMTKQVLAVAAPIFGAHLAKFSQPPRDKAPAAAAALAAARDLIDQEELECRAAMAERAGESAE